MSLSKEQWIRKIQAFLYTSPDQAIVSDFDKVQARRLIETALPGTPLSDADLNLLKGVDLIAK